MVCDLHNCLIPFHSVQNYHFNTTQKLLIKKAEKYGNEYTLCIVDQCFENYSLRSLHDTVLTVENEWLLSDNYEEVNRKGKL